MTHPKSLKFSKGNKDGYAYYSDSVRLQSRLPRKVTRSSLIETPDFEMRLAVPENTLHQFPNSWDEYNLKDDGSVDFESYKVVPKEE